MTIKLHLLVVTLHGSFRLAKFRTKACCRRSIGGNNSAALHDGVLDLVWLIIQEGISRAKPVICPGVPLMTRAISYCVSFLVQLSIVLMFAQQIFGQTVTYDCPAVLPADVVQLSSNNQIVKVVVPVSVANQDSKLKLNEVKVEVYWNRNAFPVVDYSPKTQLQSRFDGPITIEKTSETNFGVGVKASSGYLDFVSPSLNADVGKKNSESRRFNEIPEQQLLVASGTAKRGTGAFFSFKDSRIATLEGGRDLVLSFDVPVSWRGGILQVTIRSIGRRKKFAKFYDDFELARVFMLPIHIDGDDEAKNFAYRFARSEQRLRQDWNRLGSHGHSSWLASGQSQLPSMWAHYLIQSGSDTLMDQYKRQLPERLVSTANEFVVARRELVSISK